MPTVYQQMQYMFQQFTLFLKQTFELGIIFDSLFIFIYLLLREGRIYYLRK